MTYILGFVALEVPRAGTDLQTSDDFVRRLLAYFSALPPEEFSHHVELAPLLARFSTDDQFQFGIRTFLAGLHAQDLRPSTHVRDHLDMDVVEDNYDRTHAGCH